VKPLAVHYKIPNVVWSDELLEIRMRAYCIIHICIHAVPGERSAVSFGKSW
jgi:hypothetical protein